jgi:hypothetical protein
LEGGELCAHEAVPGFLSDLAFDETQYTVVLVEGALAVRGGLERLLEGEFVLEVAGQVVVFELQFWRHFERVHGSAWGGNYLCLGARMSLSWVSPPMLPLEELSCRVNMRVAGKSE